MVIPSDSVIWVGEVVIILIVIVRFPLLRFKRGEAMAHPTLAGSYLAACVFLASLLKANPVGIDSEPAGLIEKDRAALQQAAWKRCGGRK